MSLEKLMEYVSKTPSNTNPLMVKQMAREYAEHPVEELKEGGGVGYIEHKVDILMPETTITGYPRPNYPSDTLYDPGFYFGNFGGSREATVIIDGVKYIGYYVKGYFIFNREDGGIREFEPLEPYSDVIIFCSQLFTVRISPARPISPKTIVSLFITASFKLEITERATARSHAGSSARKPPTMFT